MYKSIIVSILASAVLASDSTPTVFRRQTVELPCSASGEKDCGTGCIPLTYTCCPDAQGGCPASSICWLGTNGKYGCCPLGKVCAGPGGVNTLPGGTITTTNTLPGETSTSTVTETSEPQTSTSTSIIPLPTGTKTSTSSSTSTIVGTLIPSPSSTSNAAAHSTSTAFATAGASENYGVGSGLKLLGALVAGAMMV